MECCVMLCCVVSCYVHFVPVPERKKTSLWHAPFSNSSSGVPRRQDLHVWLGSEVAATDGNSGHPQRPHMATHIYIYIISYESYIYIIYIYIWVSPPTVHPPQPLNDQHFWAFVLFIGRLPLMQQTKCWYDLSQSPMGGSLCLNCIELLYIIADGISCIHLCSHLFTNQSATFLGILIFMFDATLKQIQIWGYTWDQLTYSWIGAPCRGQCWCLTSQRSHRITCIAYVNVQMIICK